MKTTELIQKCYAAFQARDREGFAALLARDFTFTSPYDDHIDQAAYFERCWPNGERFQSFEIEKLIGAGDEAFVRYRVELKSGKKFCNTELFCAENNKIKSVEVYFGAESDAPNDEAEIRKVVEARERGVREKDAAALVALYVADARQFGLAPPLQAYGIRQSDVQGWLDSFDGAITYDVTEVCLTTGDEVALVTSLNRIAGTKTDGEKADVWVRETLGLRRVDGSWKIAHEHTSTPFLMDGSGQAALDLKPNDK